MRRTSRIETVTAAASERGEQERAGRSGHPVDRGDLAPKGHDPDLLALFARLTEVPDGSARGYRPSCVVGMTFSGRRR